jgi:hypothetical protein
MISLYSFHEKSKRKVASHSNLAKDPVKCNEHSFTEVIKAESQSGSRVAVREEIHGEVNSKKKKRSTNSADFIARAQS